MLLIHRYDAVSCKRNVMTNMLSGQRDFNSRRKDQGLILAVVGMRNRHAGLSGQPITAEGIASAGRMGRGAKPIILTLRSPEQPHDNEALVPGGVRSIRRLPIHKHPPALDGITDRHALQQ